MTEVMTAALAQRSDLLRTTDLLADRERSAPDHIAVEIHDGEAWHGLTTRDLGHDVREVARGFIGAGLEPGDRVAIMAETSYSWCVADLAAWWAGLVPVPVYPTSSARQVRAILTDSGALALIAGTESLAAIAREGGADRVWVFDGVSRHGLAEVATLGREIDEAALEVRRQLARPEDVATIAYTSGTTGEPRGARITHANLVQLALNVQAQYSGTVREGARTIVVLPLAHVLARALQLLAIGTGMRIAHLGDPKQLVPALPHLRPTFLVVVPRIMEKVLQAARERASESHLGRVFEAAERTAIAWGRHLQERQDDPRARAGMLLRARHTAFDRLFYRRIRTLFGGEIEYLLSGAAPLAADLNLFFRGAGIPIIEGYGLTETTGPATGTPTDDLRAGCVGRPIPGTAVRISPHGEVEIRGVGVCDGYTDPAATGEAFADGWFRTGDLGHLDESGRLWLSGRAKDVLVTAGGKNVTPGPWEASLAVDPLIAQAALVGDGRPYCAALVLLDREAVAAWATRHRREDLLGLTAAPCELPGIVVEDDALRQHVGLAVERANAEVSRPERARRFLLALADLDQVLTPTMKLRRAAYLDRATELVDRLYS